MLRRALALLLGLAVGLGLAEAVLRVAGLLANRLAEVIQGAASKR